MRMAGNRRRNAEPKGGAGNIPLTIEPSRRAGQTSLGRRLRPLGHRGLGRWRGRGLARLDLEG